MTSKKAVFFDIDGTLIGDDYKIIPSTRKGIEELRKKGSLAFIATGRSRAMISNEVLSVGFDGIVAACGAYVEYQGEIIFNSDLEQSLIDKSLQVLRENKIKCILEGKDYLYFDEAEYGESEKEFIEFFKNSLGSKLLDISSKEHYINKISCKIPPETDVDIIIKSLENNYDFIRHNKEFMEMIPKGYSKAKGIQCLIEHLNVKKENTYAFGDSMNDYEMLKYVEYGIAMGNSNEKILNEIKYKTDRIEDDGIYNALSRFELI